MMKSLVQLEEPRSEQTEHDQRDDDRPHVPRPIVTPPNALETAMRRAISAGHRPGGIEWTVNVLRPHGIPAIAAAVFCGDRRMNRFNTSRCKAA
jgi:hypothetical protein